MRGFRIGLACLIVSTSVPAFAQPIQPPTGGTGGVLPAQPIPPSTQPMIAPPANQSPVDPILLNHLRRWEQVLRTAENFYAEVSVVRENKLRKSKQDLKGSVMCKKPGQARMRLEDVALPGQAPDPFAYLSYIATGQSVFEYNGYEKLVTETILPVGTQSKGNVVLDLLSGSIDANTVLTRFQCKILKEDEHYIYLEMIPNEPDDQADFSVMRTVLFKDLPGLPAYLPRKIVINKPNGQEEETWDFLKVGTNVQGIKPEYFNPEPVPKEWKLVRQNAPARAPRGVTPGVPTGMQRPVVPTPGSPGTLPPAGQPPR